MSLITPSQRAVVDEFLDEQGLTFPPLRAELADHLITDLEGAISEGISFEKAWEHIVGEIPRNHFKTIQIETMEALNKRFNLSKGFTYLSLLLLTIAGLFKFMHFPGAGTLLISSFVAVALSLVTGTASGIMLYKEKKGSIMLLGIIASILLFLAGWVFKVMHLPGADFLIRLSMVSSLVMFAVLTYYFAGRPQANENILTYLHRKHTPGIERFLLILLAVSGIIRIMGVFKGEDEFVGGILLILVLGGAGMQYFALQWNTTFLTMKDNRQWLPLLLILGFVCFVIPAISLLPIEVRVVASTFFYVITGVILFLQSDQKIKMNIGILAIGLVVVRMMLWCLVMLGAIPVSFNGYLFNFVLLGILATLLVLTYKSDMYKAYMISAIGSFLFEYPAD